MIELRKARYILYAVIILAGILLRVSTSFNTILDYDASGYINPALNCFVKGIFTHDTARSYPYPLFCTAILYVFRNINAIGIVQHTAGILSGIVFLAFLEKSYSAGFNTRKKAWLFTLLATVFAAAVFLNVITILFEKSLRPEGIILPCFAVSIILIHRYFGTVAISLKFYGLLIFLLCIFALLHPRMSLAFWGAAAFISFYEIRKYWASDKRRAICSLLIPSAIYICCMLPEKKLVAEYDRQSEAFAYRHFFCRHAPAILKAIGDGNIVNEEYDNNILRNHIHLTLTDKNITYQWPILRYNIDYLQYILGDRNLDAALIRAFKQKHPELKESEYKARKDWQNRYYYYYKSWFNILVCKYPLDIAKATLKQITYAFIHPEISPVIVYSANTHIPVAPIANFAYPDYLADKLGFEPKAEVTVEFPPTLTYLFNASSFLFRPVFALCLFCSLYLLITNRLKPFHIVLLYCTISCILTIALINTFDISRFLQSLSFLISAFMLLTIFDLILKFESGDI
jgi:hypothetical protein